MTETVEIEAKSEETPVSLEMLLANGAAFQRDRYGSLDIAVVYDVYVYEHANPETDAEFYTTVSFTMTTVNRDREVTGSFITTWLVETFLETFSPVGTLR